VLVSSSLVAFRGAFHCFLTKISKPPLPTRPPLVHDERKKMQFGINMPLLKRPQNLVHCPKSCCCCGFLARKAAAAEEARARGVLRKVLSRRRRIPMPALCPVCLEPDMATDRQFATCAPLHHDKKDSAFESTMPVVCRVEWSDSWLKEYIGRFFSTWGQIGYALLHTLLPKCVCVCLLSLSLVVLRGRETPAIQISCSLCCAVGRPKPISLSFYIIGSRFDEKGLKE